jgi:hypothetical protein
MAEQPPNPNPPNPEPPLPSAPQPQSADPTAAIAALQKTVAEMPAMIAQQLQVALRGEVTEPEPVDNDWPTIQQGWLELKQSKNPADRALAAALENQARATAKLNEELAATRRELSETRQAQQAGIPSEDLEACQKYITSGDAGNLRAAHRLVLMDKQEAAAKVGVTASPAGASVSSPALPAAPRPSAASPALAPAAPSAEGPIKQSEYERVAAENVNGRPTKRALDIIEAVKLGRVTPVPG